MDVTSLTNAQLKTLAENIVRFDSKVYEGYSDKLFDAACDELFDAVCKERERRAKLAG